MSTPIPTPKKTILQKLRAGITGGSVSSPVPRAEGHQRIESETDTSGQDGTVAPPVNTPCPECGEYPCICQKMGETTTNDDTQEKDDTTMADESKNKGANPNTPPGQQATGPAAPAKIAAKMAELKEAFPDTEDMEFRCECIENGLSMIEAKAAYGDRMIAARKREREEAAEKAKTEAALGGAGISTQTAGASPREAGRSAPGRGAGAGNSPAGARATGANSIEATMLAERLRDPVTGKMGKVEGVKTFDEAYATYMQAGEPKASAYRLAVINHPDLFEVKQKEMGESLHKQRMANKNRNVGV